MRQPPAIRPLVMGIILLFTAPAHAPAASLAASAVTAHHELHLTVDPQRSMLSGRDRITIQGSPGAAIELLLAERAAIRSVAFNGQRHAYTFERGRLRIPVDRHRSSHDVTVDYTCRFDDPAPVSPVNTDNPGYGVSGTIGPSGTFLLAGAGWYPRLVGARESFNLEVTGPPGTVAVTAGHLLGIEHSPAKTVSRWQVVNPLEGVSLSAGPYTVNRQSSGHLTAVTFFYPGSRDLSPRYLEASLRHMKRYDELFGPYPYDHFAVVENFFPTGYGFPSYTLLGGRVLRLPFIPETSLPHEIVHNWWGNGVLVDVASGNWCEGLATYTADYLIKERGSAEAARDYRRQALRNYASLVAPDTDFPLSRFRSRYDPVTKAVGYDKSAMVFHMLRQTIGDEAFWAGLRRLYRQHVFKRASWEDLQAVFEHHADSPLELFFRQWVTRPGAPRLHLADVQTMATGDGFRTTGRLVQQPPYYDVGLNLMLATDGQPVRQHVRLTDAAVAFSLTSDRQPRRLVADPEYHLFRRLAPEEIPSTVNSLKGSAAVAVVLADRMAAQGRSIARRFVRAMGIDPVRWLDESDLEAIDPSGIDLLFIGLPASSQAAGWFPRDLQLTPDRFQLEKRVFHQPADLLFCVARHPDHPQTTVALLHPLAPDGDPPALTKIPHYGRYSYLAFTGGRNHVKGTWEAAASPMNVRLAAPATP